MVGCHGHGTETVLIKTGHIQNRVKRDMSISRNPDVKDIETQEIPLLKIDMRRQSVEGPFIWELLVTSLSHRSPPLYLLYLPRTIGPIQKDGYQGLGGRVKMILAKDLVGNRN